MLTDVKDAQPLFDRQTVPGITQLIRSIASPLTPAARSHPERPQGPDGHSRSSRPSTLVFGSTLVNSTMYGHAIPRRHVG